MPPITPVHIILLAITAHCGHSFSHKAGWHRRDSHEVTDAYVWIWSTVVANPQYCWYDIFPGIPAPLCWPTLLLLVLLALANGMDSGIIQVKVFEIAEGQRRSKLLKVKESWNWRVKEVQNRYIILRKGVHLHLIYVRVCSASPLIALKALDNSLALDG